MKTITLDFDLYEKELQDKFESGKKHGIWCAARYVQSPDTHYVNRREYYLECEHLDDAIKARIEQGASNG